jgi:hypothetical protein
MDRGNGHAKEIMVGEESALGFANVEDGPIGPVAGSNCLIKLTDRNFMVRILEVTDDTLRVSFPGLDYPVAGMLIDVEFHDPLGFSFYRTKVLKGPEREGEGILLERPSEAKRSQHRDSCRVPAELKVEVKGQVHVRKHKSVLLNVSTGGALLQSPGEFEVGDVVEIPLKLPGETESYLVLAEILHRSEPVEIDGEKVFLYGTRFAGYDPGTGRALTSYIWDRLRELYPSV